jgi:CRP-like cAMP-binding protein/membrane protein YdbS with pleckstrin-like domain
MFPKLGGRLQGTQVVNRLLSFPLFASFSEAQLFHVAELAQVEKVGAGRAIFLQGQPADAFYVIDAGQVVERAGGPVPDPRAWPRYLTAGSSFGHHGLLHNVVRRATAEAVSDVRLFRFDADAFDWLLNLNPEFEQALQGPDVVSYLRSSSIFARLDEEELKHLAGFVGLARFRPEDVVYRQGEVDPTYYMLTEGEAIIRGRDEQGNQRPRGYLKAGESVGKSSLFLKDPRDVTVEATTDTHWLYLTRDDLDRFLTRRPTAEGKLVFSEPVQERQRLQRFPWMDPDEQLVLRNRRHWFVLADKLIIPVLLLVVALAVFAFSELDILGIVMVAVAGLWIAWRVVDWSNDYYEITTKRVAHREKVLLVSETRDETPLDKIQNVNVERGLFGNVLGFGSLIMDTAAASGVPRVTFSHMTAPDQVQALIFEQISRVQAGERSQTRRAIRDQLETTMGAGVRPTLVRPAVAASAASPPSEGESLLQRIYDATLGRTLWIERRTETGFIWRKHWIRLLYRIWLPTLFFLVVFAALILYLTSAQNGQGLFLAMFSALLVIAGIWWWWNYEDWGNDRYEVTNDRLIDTEKLPLGLSSRRTETTFDRIQNVSFDIPHPIATLLNYGTVFIHTAGAEGRLDFSWVRNPRKVQAEVFRRLTAYTAAQRDQQTEEQWAELPEWFAAYEQTRRSRP